MCHAGLQRAHRARNSKCNTCAIFHKTLPRERVLMPQRGDSGIVRRSWQTILARVRTGSVRRLSVLLGPRSHASHAVHRDVGDVSGWGVVHRREADLRTKVGVSEVLKELGSSSLGNARRAINDEVLVEAHSITRGGFDRKSDAATALKFPGLWALVSGFPGLVTVWRLVGHGGVTGRGGTRNETKLQVGRGLSTPIPSAGSFVACSVCHACRFAVHPARAGGRRRRRGGRGDGRPDRVRAGLLDAVAV